jgi:hypothetical protein
MLKSRKQYLSLQGRQQQNNSGTGTVTPGAVKMLSAAGPQQQQKSLKQHKCHKQLGRHNRGDDNNVETPGSEHKCQQQHDLSNIRMLTIAWVLKQKER